MLRLPAARPTALRFLRLVVPRLHSLRSLLDGRVHRRGLELFTRYLQPGCCRGNDRISQVPGESQLSVCTCSSDAGRTACTRPLWCNNVALGFCNAKAPTKGLSTLNSMAFGLAVYACMLVLSSKLIVCFRFAGVRKTLSTLRFDLFAKIVSSTL